MYKRQPVHLERMKTLENILDAKSEIVDLTGSVVINGDDSLLLNQARLWTAQKMVIDCSTTSERAAVFVDYKNNVHSVYIGGEFIGNVEGPKILQLSISLCRLELWLHLSLMLSLISIILVS